MESYSIQEYNDFDWKSYKELNPFLYIHGLRNQEEYEKNYIYEGRYLGRYYHMKYKTPKTFHVLIATIGKQSIFRMLESLKEELEQQDFLTIVFDGTNNNYDIIEKYIQNNFQCTFQLIIEEKNLGFWGHGIRNKHQELKGDFIYHCDDDDIIVPGTFYKFRKICIHEDTIYIFKIKTENNDIIWKEKNIQLMNISTQSGVIPNKINKQGFWKLKYGGDYDFYKSITQNNKVLFVNQLIYIKYKL